MALTLTEIETIVRHEARSSTLNISSGTGLSVFNMLYRRFSALFPWTELIKTDSSLTTVSGTGSYTWPSTFRYSDVRSVQMQNPAQNNKYITIVPTSMEILLSSEEARANGFPTVYKREHDATNNIIKFAPTPNTTGLGIKITGVTEPENLTSGSDATIFLEKTADDALSYLISADYMFKRAQPERGSQLVDVARSILSSRFGKEIASEEVVNRMVNA